MVQLYLPLLTLSLELLEKGEERSPQPNPPGFHPRQFSRAVGGIRGEPELEVHVEEGLLELWGGLVHRLAGYALERAKDLLPRDLAETVALHPLREGIPLLPQPRWGKRAGGDLPPCPWLYLDPPLRRAVRSDPALTRSFSILEELGRTFSGSREPLHLLFFYALMKTQELALPEPFAKGEFQPVRLLFSGLFQELCQEFLGAILPPLFPAMIRSRLLPLPVLPQPLLPLYERAKEEARRGRRTPRQFLVIFEERLTEALKKPEIEEGLSLYFKNLLYNDLKQLGETRDSFEVTPSLFYEDPQLLSRLWEALKQLAPPLYEERMKEWKEAQGLFKEKLRLKKAQGLYASWGAGMYAEELLKEGYETSLAAIRLAPQDPERIALEKERGTLYSFSREASGTPVQALPQMGFLFADFRGFTTLTMKAKEAETGAFLREEFYSPMLAILAEEVSGLSGRWEESAVRINNLLGDAISACGDLIALLFAAEKMKGFLESRRDELLRSTPREYHELIREVDCGIYVGFGTAPLILEIPSPFGTLKVAIGEKLNESARGVNRDGEVHEFMERVRGEQPGKEWLFRVHILPVLAGEFSHLPDPLPSAQEDLETLLLTGTLQPRYRARMGMYNVGIALSKEALLKAGELGGVRAGQSLSLPRDSLAKAFPSFIILEPRVQLFVFSLRNHPCLIRKVGHLVFKGFEGTKPQEILEWIPRESPCFATIHELVRSRGKEISLSSWLGSL